MMCMGPGPGMRSPDWLRIYQARLNTVNMVAPFVNGCVFGPLWYAVRRSGGYASSVASEGE